VQQQHIFEIFFVLVIISILLLILKQKALPVWGRAFTKSLRFYNLQSSLPVLADTTLAHILIEKNHIV